MTRPIPTLVAAVALLLAPLPALAQVRSQSAKAYSERLSSLTDVQRRGALRRAVLDSGEKCVTVTKAAYQGPFKNMEMWVARCSNPAKAGPALDYGLFVGSDGSVQVSGCPYLLTVRWPACRRLD